jgi:hypothetical protein
VGKAISLGFDDSSDAGTGFVSGNGSNLSGSIFSSSGSGGRKKDVFNQVTAACCTRTSRVLQ